jgi:hypothetical protein
MFQRQRQPSLRLSLSPACQTDHLLLTRPSMSQSIHRRDEADATGLDTEVVDEVNTHDRLCVTGP